MHKKIKVNNNIQNRQNTILFVGFIFILLFHIPINLYYEIYYISIKIIDFLFITFYNKYKYKILQGRVQFPTGGNSPRANIICWHGAIPWPTVSITNVIKSGWEKNKWQHLFVLIKYIFCYPLFCLMTVWRF